MDKRPIYGVVLLSILYVGYCLWNGASLKLTAGSTFLLLVGIGLTIYGTFGILDPRTVARLSEQVDAIGSTTPFSEVEPTAWNVSFTKIQSGFVFIIGLFHLGLALLTLIVIS